MKKANPGLVVMILVLALMISFLATGLWVYVAYLAYSAYAAGSMGAAWGWTTLAVMALPFVLGTAFKGRG